MKHLAAYLLLVAGGNASPSADQIKTLLSSVGVEVDQSRVSALLKAMEGKTAAEVCFGINIEIHVDINLVYFL
jgi:large subunit ribosomal protein LP2